MYFTEILFSFADINDMRESIVFRVLFFSSAVVIQSACFLNTKIYSLSQDVPSLVSPSPVEDHPDQSDEDSTPQLKQVTDFGTSAQLTAIELNDALLFSASTAANGIELWRLDYTTQAVSFLN